MSYLSIGLCVLLLLGSVLSGKPILSIEKSQAGLYTYDPITNTIETNKRQMILEAKVKSGHHVTVLGERIVLPKSGLFKKKLALSPGINTIEVTAVDADGESLIYPIAIRYSSVPGLDPDRRRQIVNASVEAMDYVFKSAGMKSVVMPQDEREKFFGKIADSIYLMQVGMQHFYNKDYTSAVSAYQEVVYEFPNFAYAHVRLGSLYYQLGDFNNAKESWSKALVLDPERSKVRQYIALSEEKVAESKKSKRKSKKSTSPTKKSPPKVTKSDSETKKTPVINNRKTKKTKKAKKKKDDAYNIKPLNAAFDDSDTMTIPLYTD